MKKARGVAILSFPHCFLFSICRSCSFLFSFFFYVCMLSRKHLSQNSFSTIHQNGTMHFNAKQKKKANKAAIKKKKTQAALGILSFVHLCKVTRTRSGFPHLAFLLRSKHNRHRVCTQACTCCCRFSVSFS